MLNINFVKVVGIYSGRGETMLYEFQSLLINYTINKHQLYVLSIHNIDTHDIKFYVRTKLGENHMKLLLK